jgi:ferredoxin
MSSNKRPAWGKIRRGLCMAKINTTKCIGCGGCIDLCPVIAIAMIHDVVTVDEDTCTKCGICIRVCPVRAPYEP